MVHSLIVRPVIVILRSILITVCFIGGAIASGPLPADPVPFDIGEQPLRNALTEFARQSDRELLFSTDVVEDKVANHVDGTYEPEDALELLLADTGLAYSVTVNDTILVAEGDGGPDSRNSRARPVLMAQNQTPAAQKRSATQSEDDEEDRLELEKIVVTGTHIRGIAPDSSPVRIYTSEDIQISGAATAQDFIQTLTAYFGGGSNSSGSLAFPNDDNSTFNASNNGGSFGSSVNLRGLGSGSTLVLLNGHRLAPASGIGDFTDISMIPASALERVEVVTDGASSIYGSDAVAGVVNFITRDDFDAVEASFRYGSVTAGSLEEYRTGITGGKNWNTGNALLVYEYFDQSNLSAGDREFSQDAVLPNDLLPSQERHSVLASISQEVSADIQVFSDLAYFVRDTKRSRTQTDGDIVHYSSSSDSLSIAGGGLWSVSAGWILDVAASYSDLNNDTGRTVEPVGSFPAAIQQDREVDSTLWTVDVKASGTVFELPGGELKIAVGGHYRGEEFTNFRVETDQLERDAKRDVYALFGEAFIPIVGPNNAVPGVDRLELNISGRYDHYNDFGSTANPKVGVLWSPFDGFNFRGSYSTSFNPPPLGRVGASDFSALAARTSLINSNFGLTPADPTIADVVVITAFGTANELKAEDSTAFTAGLDFSNKWGNHGLTVTATYFDIDFEGRLGSTPMPQNRTVFDAPNIAFNNPDRFPEGTVIFWPSQSEIQDLLDVLDLPIGAIGGADPIDAEILNLAAVARNLARTKVSGLDVDVSYTFDADIGALLLGLDASYLIDFQQQAAVTTPFIERINTLHNPVDLKLRGRAGYSNSVFDANVFVNYVKDYRVDNTDNAESVNSWTTVDISLSHDTQQKSVSAIFNDLILRMSVRNLLDKAPPSTPSNPPFGIYGFDPANASPVGRFIAFELTKRF